MDSEERTLAGIIWCLRTNANNGHTCVRENDLSDAVTYELNITEKQFWEGLMLAEQRCEIVRSDKYDDKFVFLAEYYRAECYIAEKLAEMIKRNDCGGVDYSEEIAGIEWEQGIQYEKLQREAISGCMNNHVFILTGGPGTGKTTTLNAVISLCRQRKLKMKLAGSHRSRRKANGRPYRGACADDTPSAGGGFRHVVAFLQAQGRESSCLRRADNRRDVHG